MAGAVCLGLAMYANAGESDPSSKPPQKPSLLGRFFNRPSPDDALTQEADAQDKQADKELAAARARVERGKIDALRARDNYFRRDLVLDILAKHAEEAGDQALSRKIEALRDRAWNVYLKKNPQPAKDEAAQPAATVEGESRSKPIRGQGRGEP
jgi:hypothetical protein